MAELPPCTNCGGPVKRRESHGWCGGCRHRWYRAGMPESGPPPRKFTHPGRPVSPETREKIRAAIHDAYEERLAYFRKLDRAVDGASRRDDARLSDREIAELMGVTRRSVWRYRAAERAAGRGWYKNGRPRSRDDA